MDCATHRLAASSPESDARSRDERSSQLCTSGSGASCSTTATGSDTYAYDVNDNRTRVLESNGATSSDRRYCYDAQNRLTYRNTAAACSSTTKDESYAYDAAGNRTQTASGATITNFAYNPDGQLCKVGGSDCTGANVSYDTAGRTRSWNGWFFAYDGEGRLVSACKDSNCATGFEQVHLAYDGEGRRTQLRTVSAAGTTTTVDFRYQGASVVEEHRNGSLHRQFLVDESGAIVKLIVPTGLAGAGTYLVTWNGHGDALALYRQNTDANGQFDGSLSLANSYTYSSWGAPTVTPHNGIADLGFRFLYVGRFGVQWDNAFGLGLHYMQARHYAPALGRFIQPDPSQLEANHYGYAGGSPVTRIDPSGLLSGPELQQCFKNIDHCKASLDAGATAYARSFALMPPGAHRDALRHCIWQCLLTLWAGPQAARQWGNAHERGNRGSLGSTIMDQRNNRWGRVLGLKLKNRPWMWLGPVARNEATNACMRALGMGQLWVITNNRLTRSGGEAGGAF